MQHASLLCNHIPPLVAPSHLLRSPIPMLPHQVNSATRVRITGYDLPKPAQARTAICITTVFARASVPRCSPCACAQRSHRCTRRLLVGPFYFGKVCMTSHFHQLAPWLSSGSRLRLCVKFFVESSIVHLAQLHVFISCPGHALNLHPMLTVLFGRAWESRSSSKAVLWHRLARPQVLFAKARCQTILGCRAW